MTNATTPLLDPTSSTAAASDQPPDAVAEAGGPAAPGGQPSRRHVLRMVGYGGLVVLAAGSGALGYRVYDTAVLDPGSGKAYDPWRHWRDTPGPLGAVGAAILAANPHDTQPWLFHVTDTAVDVYADPARSLGTVDPLLREMHVGLGCAVENVVLACRARGLQPTVGLLPDGPRGARVAHVALTAAAVRASALHDAIGRRHTDRGPYDGRPVPAAALAGLVDTTGLPGLAVYWVTAAADMAALGTLLVDAATALTHDQQQSMDSFAWFRADDDAVQRHQDGLTLDAQGLSPLVLSLGKLLPASSRSAGDAFWVGQTRTVHTATAAAYGVITATDPYDRTVELEAGRLLQRIHLTATVEGIALQCLNQITERVDRELTTGAAATFAPRFADLLPPGARPVITFRVGHPARAARPSPRRPVAAVTR